MYIVDINKLLVETLRNNVPNPHGSGNWIYIGYPRMDVTFPRISVTNIGGDLSPISIGEKVELTSGTFGLLSRLDYDIDVWVKVNDRATFNSTTYVGTKLRDYLADKVIQALENKKEEIKNSHEEIVDIEIRGITSQPLDEANMLHRKTISISVSFIWTKT